MYKEIKTYHMLMITIQRIIFLVKLFIPICRYTHKHTHCMSHPNMQLKFL